MTDLEKAFKKVHPTAKMKNKGKKASGSGRNEWSCAQCTLDNSAESPRCKACDTARDHGRKQQRFPPVSIACPACTYENESGETCEICGTRLLGGGGRLPSSISSPLLSHLSLGNGGLPRDLPDEAAPLGQATRLKVAAAANRPESAASLGSRHESELMDQLREVEESEARDRWKNIVHFFKVNGHSFVDDEFPPTNKSLYYSPNSTKTNHHVGRTNCEPNLLVVSRIQLNLIFLFSVKNR